MPLFDNRSVAQACNLSGFRYTTLPRWKIQALCGSYKRLLAATNPYGSYERLWQLHTPMAAMNAYDSC